MKNLKIALLKYPLLYRLIFNIYAIVRYPHFIIVGFFLKLTNSNIKYQDKLFSIPRNMTSPLFLGSFYFIGIEEDEILAIDKYLNKEAIVLELGGCLGFVSCYLNEKLINPENHVVLEANPHLIDFLEKNKNHNNSKFKIINKMISNKKQNTFYIGKSIHSSSANKKSGRACTIQGISILQLQHDLGLNFDTLIMDIEGGEYDLFKTTDFSKLGVKTLIFELHDFNRVLNSSQVTHIKNILENYNFTYIETIGTSQIWQIK